ncbi:glycosyltransferase [Oceanospirillum sp. HFRX-1_2]
MRLFHVVLNDYRPDKRVHKAACLAVSQGYEVTVLATNRSNFQSRHEYVDGVEVIRLGGFLSLPWSNVFKIFNIVFFMFFVKKMFVKKKPDIVHIHDLSGLVASFFILKKAKKIVYDAHEYFSQDYLALSMPIPLAYAAHFIHNILAARANVIITVGDMIADRLRSDIKGAENKVYVVRNVPDLDTVTASEVVVKNFFSAIEDPYIFIHVGRTENGRQFDKLIDALKEADDNICLLFLGASLALQDLVNSKAKEFISRVACIDPVPSNEVYSIVKQAHCGLVWFDGSCENFRLAMPNKIFDYLSANIPVLVNDLPGMSTFINNTSTGVVFSSDGHDLSVKMNSMLDLKPFEVDLLRSNVSLQATKCNWNVESMILKDIYKELGGSFEFDKK